METNKQQRKKWFLPLVLSLLLLTLLILFSIFVSTDSSSLLYLYRTRGRVEEPRFVESKLRVSSTSSSESVPRIAYLISGSVGDGETLKRTLKALYHPRNQYAVHLDLEASTQERLELANFVKNEPLFAKLGNVRMVVKANLVTYRGPTMVTNTLHAAAILFKEGGLWDWFINLSASDYPLVTQDGFGFVLMDLNAGLFWNAFLICDLTGLFLSLFLWPGVVGEEECRVSDKNLLHTLSSTPRHLNFIEHTSDIGWKEDQRAKPVIIDPALYSVNKSDLFWVTEKRNVPTAYKLFTGSAWMMLSRQFVEYLLWGWDNLPRIVLMYYANFLSSPEGYFHTVICNADEFRNTTVNHDLHFISWDNPPKQHPHFLTINNYEEMVESNAPFARKFGCNEQLLDKIDTELLGRNEHGYVPGKWFDRTNSNTTKPYSAIKNITELKPGPGAERLKRLINGLLSAEDFHTKQCS
ncbi:beta-glucuronosyltransferase GlcAT14B isoform X1 [Vigna angularis]|uniref:beta-glucuronosyltransferase GlcAT14B isoform X1 n=1 Tax=Phaseolus angularis TaxID=3914 RepID=UPI0022B31446|nr:beta-glucuronosyltransferase GlcAT14B isoform X1 [Vigna angularis]